MEDSFKAKFPTPADELDDVFAAMSAATSLQVSDPEIKVAFEIVLAAIGTEKQMLASAVDDWDVGERSRGFLRSLAKPDPPDEPALREAWMRIHATIDHLRLSLDEGREAQFIKELERLELYSLPQAAAEGKGA